MQKRSVTYQLTYRLDGEKGNNMKNISIQDFIQYYETKCSKYGFNTFGTGKFVRVSYEYSTNLDNEKILYEIRFHYGICRMADCTYEEMIDIKNEIDKAIALVKSLTEDLENKYKVIFNILDYRRN